MATVKQAAEQPPRRVHILEQAIRAHIWTHAAVRYRDGQAAPLAAGEAIRLDGPIAEDSLECSMLVYRLCPGATTCKSEYEIRAFLSEVVVAYRLGLGFHPDTPFEDYVSFVDGSRVFTDEEASRFDRLMNDAFNYIAATPSVRDIYELTIELINELYLSAVGV